MKRQMLLDALELVHPAVASGRPLTEEFAAFAFDGKTIRASDGTMAIETTLDEDTGLKCLVDAKQFYKLVKNVKEDDLTLSVEDGKLVINGKAIKGVYNISLEEDNALARLDFAVDEWLSIPEGMSCGVRLAQFAVSKDNSRGVLCGVKIAGDKVTASDGFRILEYSMKSEVAEPFIIRANLAREIARHSEKLTGLAVKDDRVFIRLENGTVLYGMTITGVYPDTQKYIDDAKASVNQSIKFNDELSGVLRRHEEQLSEVDEWTREVEITLAGDTLTVASSDVSYSLTETLQLESKASADFKFKINPKFLRDILAMTYTMHFGTGDMVAFKQNPLYYVMMVTRI